MISRVDIRSFTLNQAPRFSKIPHSHSNNELSLLKRFHQSRFVASSEPPGKCLQRCFASLQTTHISDDQLMHNITNSGSYPIRDEHHCCCPILQQYCNDLHHLVNLNAAIANNVQCIPPSLQCHTSVANKWLMLSCSFTLSCALRSAPLSNRYSTVGKRLSIAAIINGVDPYWYIHRHILMYGVCVRSLIASQTHNHLTGSFSFTFLLCSSIRYRIAAKSPPLAASSNYSCMNITVTRRVVVSYKSWHDGFDELCFGNDDLQANQTNKPSNRLPIPNGWLNIQWKLHNRRYKWIFYLNNSQSCIQANKTAPTSFIEQEKAHHTSGKEFISHTSPLRLPKWLCNRGKTSNKCLVSRLSENSIVFSATWLLGVG